MKAFYQIAFALLLAAPACLQAAGNDKIAEARADYEKTDAELNAAYKKLLAGLDDAEAAKLRANELGWLRYRDSMIQTFTRLNGGKWPEDKGRTAKYWDSLASLTGSRIGFLSRWTGKDKELPRGITAEYEDSRGGDLSLQVAKGGIAFRLIVVRGDAETGGHLEGLLHRKGDKGYFKEKMDAGDHKPPCELIFTFIAGHIVHVEEKAPDPYANPGAYAGDYYKVGASSNSIDLP